MPKFHIEKSIEINAPADKVRRVIQDYDQWAPWSPWLCMEPDAQLKMEGTAANSGHAYSWEGDMIGAGRMELATIEGPTDHMDLTFLKPFKSTAKVKFDTHPTDNNTSQVTWHMHSGLPFFMFFMVGTMKAMIGMDYERGLKLLKEYVETGEVSSVTKIMGVVDVPATHYVGAAASCSLANIASSMEETFPKVTQLADGAATGNYSGAIYHNMNIKTQQCDYTAFAPVDEAAAKGTIPDCRAIKVVHTGSYQHLGNAWATINTYQRHKKLKKNKSIAPFEFYTNDPTSTANKDLVTEIYLPVNA